MTIIEVEGKGIVHEKPNILIFNITFNIKGKNYEDAVNNELENINKFFRILENEKIDSDRFKTLNYSVMPFYKTKKSGIIEKTEENIQDGYIVKREGFFKTKLDFKLIQKFISAFEDLNIDVNMEFGINNEKEVCKKAMKLAYEDAYEKIEFLANISDKTLDFCEKISYSNSYNNFSGMCHCITVDEFFQTFNLEDIKIEERVELKWKLK